MDSEDDDGFGLSSTMKHGVFLWMHSWTWGHGTDGWHGAASVDLPSGFLLMCAILLQFFSLFY